VHQHSTRNAAILFLICITSSAKFQLPNRMTCGNTLNSHLPSNDARLQEINS